MLVINSFETIGLQLVQCALKCSTAINRGLRHRLMYLMAMVLSRDVCVDLCYVSLMRQRRLMYLMAMVLSRDVHADLCYIVTVTLREMKDNPSFGCR